VDQPEALFKAIANGYLRLAAESDRPLMLEWFQAFADGAIAPFVPVHPICLTDLSAG